MKRKNWRKALNAIGVGLLLVVVVVGIIYAAVKTVDTFDVGTQDLTATSGSPDASNQTGPHSGDVLGDYRDAEVHFSSGSGDVVLKIDTTSYPDRLALSVGSEANGTARITWDGNDAPDSLSPTGLNNADLVDGTNDGIYMKVIFDDQTATIRLTGYEDASNYEHLEYTINQEDKTIRRLDLFYPFVDFDLHKTGTGADWTSLGALVMYISGDPALDMTVDFMDSRGKPREYGDLPDSSPNYSAVLDAYHVPHGLTLGYNLDTESSYHASSDARGDDTSDYDDEDGVTPSYKQPIPGTWVWYAHVTVNGCPGTCYLNGWIDWNSDGDFSDTNEHFISNVSGSNSSLSTDHFLAFASSVNPGYYYLRFRVCVGSGDCNDPGVSEDEIVDNGEVEDYKWYMNPTAVTLTSFTATWDGRQVLVAWETTLEVDTVGFNLWRSTTPDGPCVQINDALIPSASPGGTWGASYSYTDSDVTQGTAYYYKLEELEVGGASNWYGPVPTGGGGEDSPTVVTLSTFMAEGGTTFAWWSVAAAVAAGAGLVALAWLRRRH